MAERFGFQACCGTEMAVVDGCVCGAVSAHCDSHAKAAFTEEACASRGLLPSSAAPIGDSRSDILPLLVA